jgi:hypothetical protein
MCGVAPKYSRLIPGPCSKRGVTGCERDRRAISGPVFGVKVSSIEDLSRSLYLSEWLYQNIVLSMQILSQRLSYDYSSLMLLVISNKLLHCLWPTCKWDFCYPWPDRGSGFFNDVSGHGVFERSGGFFG